MKNDEKQDVVTGEDIFAKALRSAPPPLGTPVVGAWPVAAWCDSASPDLSQRRRQAAEDQSADKAAHSKEVS